MISLGNGTKFWLYSKPTNMRGNLIKLSGKAYIESTLSTLNTPRDFMSYFSKLVLT